jgi:N4-gp56 family major capsid protein
MAFSTSQITDFSTAIAGNADLKAKAWSLKVRRAARQKNALREFIGKLGSAMPIIEESNLTKDIGDTVVFTSIAEERGQGTLGENDLRTRTGKLRPGTMSVQLDILKHAVTVGEKFKIMTVAGKSSDQITSDLMTGWLHRKEEDDFQVAALRTCRLLAPGTNLLQIGGAATLDGLKSANTINTAVIEDVKGMLNGLGAKEISMSKEASGAENLRYMFFGTDRFMRPLRSSAAYLAALQTAENRGPANRLFTGEYGMWDNTVLYTHNLKIDEAAGRQGSPLAPFARLGTALTTGSETEVTGGGGSVSPADLLGDFFANFPGYLWKFVDSETPPADSGPHYAMIYNVSGAAIGSYEIVKYTTGNDGNKITAVTRGTTTTTGGGAGGGNVTAQAAGRFTTNHPVGSLIFPCTINGVPYGYALALGAEALAYATGKYNAQPIEHYEGFVNAGTKQADLNSFGLKSIRGISAYKNAAGDYPNLLAVRGAIVIPGVSPVAYNP